MTQPPNCSGTYNKLFNNLSFIKIILRLFWVGLFVFFQLGVVSKVIKSLHNIAYKTEY